MSSVEGAFGDPRYVFEVSDVPSGYTEVDYVESDGRQWIDTGVTNNSSHEVSINNSSKNSRLGADYTELEYIESNGTQFIKTGVFGCAKWTISIQFTQFGTRMLMGYNGNGANYWGVAEENADRGTEEGDYESYNSWDGHIKAGNKDVIIDDFGDSTDGQEIRYLNGTAVFGPRGISQDVSEVDYELLALDNGKAPCYAKLYSVKAEKKGVLICDFVPAQERSSGRVGLFDMVTKKFIGNSGTGEFIKGSEVEYTPAALPEEYQELEYLEATGTQTINLNTTVNLETASIKVSYQASVMDQDGMIFGVKNDSCYIWLFHTKSSGGFNFYVRGNALGQQPLGYSQYDLNRHNVEYKNKTYYIDGVQRSTANGELDVVPKLYLFSQGNAYFQRRQ